MPHQIGKMRNIKFLTGTGKFILTGLGVATFSNFIIVLFGQTIPNIVWSFFKDLAALFILVVVFAFAITWFLKTRPHNRPKWYYIITYDVFGNESNIDGIRTKFKIHDVAWSFMKQYKKSYPMNNFALVANQAKSHKKTIFRYI